MVSLLLIKLKTDFHIHLQY